MVVPIFASFLNFTPIVQDYKSGKLLTGQLKARCIKELQGIMKGFQEVRSRSSPCIVNLFIRLLQRRAKITDDEVKSFMDPTRKIDKSYKKLNVEQKQ